MSKMPKKNKEKQFKSVGSHQQFLQRITKTLYYGKLPSTERLSLPVTELAAELFSEAQSGRSLERLHCNDAAKISRNACVSPCSLVLAMLYLEQLKTCNREYLQRIAPSELFLVSLMVSSKFLHDDGEEDEVFIDEWASSGGISIKELIQLEKEFLGAMHWEVFIHEHKFWKKLGELETSIAKRQGTGRGWFTYTELQNLLTTIDITNFIQGIAAVISVLLATYTLGVLTLVGSIFIVSNIPGSCLQNRDVYMENKTYLSLKNKEPAILNTANNTSDISPILDNAGIDDDETFMYKNNLKHLDAADVLKTGILLASLKAMPNSKRNFNKSHFETEIKSNVTENSWAWWSSPTMDWLTKTSKMIENFDFIPNFKHFIYDKYIDMSIVNYKIINLQDHIHKATKVRIQDQMERSWHIEWTDTLKNVLLEYKLFSLF